MNRDIKFRAWNGEAMEYGGFSIHASGTVEPLQGLTKVRTESEIMQFTGLKDNTGKDIYEGDVLKFDANEWGSEDGIFTVEWNEKDGEWDTGGGTNSECSSFKTVIGHAFEDKRNKQL